LKNGFRQPSPLVTRAHAKEFGWGQRQKLRKAPASWKDVCFENVWGMAGS
jgi:hypothetical protein